MARPLKPDAERRTVKPGVLYTLAEFAQLEKNAAAAGMTVSDWTRTRTANAKPQRRQATPERQALIKYLGQLGNIRADINRLVKDRQAHSFVRPEEVSAALYSVTQLADLVFFELSGDGD